MADLLTTCLTAPTVVYTALLGLVAAYWLLVAVGAFDIDLLDAEVDLDAGGDGLHPHGLLEFLSLGQVPVTLLATFLVTFGWFLCLVGEVALRGTLGALLPGRVYDWAMGVGAALAAVPLTGLAARPLRGLFTLRQAVSKRGIVGSALTVTSVTADERFGTAVAEVGGDEIILHVVTRAGVTMAKGDAGVVVEYDDERDRYLIAPLPHLQPGFLEAPARDPAPPADPAAPAAPATTVPPVRPDRETA